ncbi:hypothetical protein FSARC_3238 [Fusarium sarcochroum]|uniref:DUF7908 domain-containing protein n=1 Tax=Fusarium sarcochroum TaxID=1208366 RepID=A0A8H4U459_9HYPO|nr:hypothetical protein FSARC_3238 [Fusarium sarcochroum]
MHILIIAIKYTLLLPSSKGENSLTDSTIQLTIMKCQIAALAALGSCIKTVNAIDNADLVEGTYCLTYLSTFLEPVSYGTAQPQGQNLGPSATVTVPNSVLTDIADVIQPTSSSANLDPAGQRVIFLVTPSGDINKRELNGFVGNGNPDVCTFATVFTLGQSQLFDGNVRLGYAGGGYQSLQLQSLPDDAITRSFTNAGGNLQFKNSALPNGQAGFCQDTSDGQVYMTFTSEPPSCIPVVLAIYGVEQCVDGRLIGFNDPTTTGAQIDTTEVGPTDNPVTSVPDQPVDTEPFPEQPTTDMASRPFTSLPPIWANTSRSEIPSVEPTAPVQPTSFESSEGELSILPTDVESSSDSPIFIEPTTSLEPLPTADFTPAESSATDTPLPPDVETSSKSQIIFTEFTTTQESLSSIESSETDTLFPSPSESSSTGDIPSTSATDSLEISTDITSQTTDVPSTTPSDLPTTTTSEDDIIITNRVANGRFVGGLEGFDSEGEVRHQLGGYFEDDASPDDACAALEAVGDSQKRSMGSFAGMWQLLGFLQPSNTVLYTVQFYYAVMTGGGFQQCTVSAYLGNRQFYSMSLFSVGESVSWNRVLISVIADSRSAKFGISMTCMGDGQAVIYVDAVFVSNEVTPKNIDNFKLDFGVTPPGPQTPGKSGSTSLLPDGTTSTDLRSSNTGLPEVDTSSETWGYSTPILIGTQSWSPLSETTDETSTSIPTPTTEEGSSTTFSTTTESETPTELCEYTHGEECEFDRFNYPQDALCAYDAFFNGPTWTESRTDYPHQESPYQCIAICHGMENCASVGYWQLENRCIFTSVIIKQSDFTICNNGDWRHAYWVDKRCRKCPNCIPASVPNTPPERCSYKEGDACTRVDNPASSICNFSAYMGGGYWTGDQWQGQYPRQDLG